MIVRYYVSRIDETLLSRDVLPCLQGASPDGQPPTFDEIRAKIPVSHAFETDRPDEVEAKLKEGFALIQLAGENKRWLLAYAGNHGIGQRKNNETENEFSVGGPKVGFVESLEVNMALMRRIISVPELVFEETTIGGLSETKIAIAYLDGITNPELVQTVRQRLEAIDFDVVFDSTQLDQIMADNSNTPFPLFLTTERADRVTYAMTSGQVAIFSDGSPYAITGPSTFLDFFISPEDYYLPWILGSFFRLIRLFSVLFSVFASPLYVAIITFHYEMLPDSILVPLVLSRIHVPFPPLLEVIFLETTIELLREVGARLPTKIGQTLGIVGGIVIGQATVQAALTSNILLIIVALAAG